MQFYPITKFEVGATELTFEEQCVVLNGLRNAIEYALAKHQADPCPDDGYWLSRAQETFAVYRKLGGHQDFAQLS